MNDKLLCPHCGAELRGGAAFCRECGASDDSGWIEDEDHRLEDDFDYDEYLSREFPQHASPSARLRHWFVVAVIVTLAALIMLASITAF